jgi:hypothetical protein
VNNSSNHTLSLHSLTSSTNLRWLSLTANWTRRKRYSVPLIIRHGPRTENTFPILLSRACLDPHCCETSRRTCCRATVRGRIQSKHIQRIVAWLVCRDVFTEPLPSNALRKSVIISTVNWRYQHHILSHCTCFTTIQIYIALNGHFRIMTTLNMHAMILKTSRKTVTYLLLVSGTVHQWFFVKLCFIKKVFWPDSLQFAINK